MLGDKYGLEPHDIIDEPQVALELGNEIAEADVLQVDEETSVVLPNRVGQSAPAPVVELRECAIEPRDDVSQAVDDLLGRVVLDIRPKDVDCLVLARPSFGGRRRSGCHCSSWSRRPQLVAGARKGRS